MIQQVQGKFRGIPYVVRLVSPRVPSDTLWSWGAAEWEIDCEAVEVVTFPSFAGDTERYVRDETERILAMLMEAREHGSRESA